MADSTNKVESANHYGRVMFGRRQIFTDVSDINAGNIVDVIREAMGTHMANMGEIDYLYRYYKGEQPILGRVKEVRPEINNKVVVNRANEIVAFKSGYLVGEPIQYVNRRGDNALTDDITLLNDFMVSQDKAAKDKELADWFHICGVAYRLILPVEEKTLPEESPFELHTLDPRGTFVVRYNNYAKKPVLGVTYTKNNATGETTYDAYTATQHFRVVDDRVVSETYHILGGIPIVEYPANSARLGSFEIVLSLLDSINATESNREDAIEQFVQALLVFMGANIEREQLISLKDLGALKLPENADVKYLVEELNQTQAQIKTDNDYQTVLTICGMPNRNGGSSTSDTGSAVIMRDGWEAAEARAKDSETIFKCSEKESLKIALKICRDMGRLNLLPSDIDARFTRRNYENIQAKAQVLTIMLQQDKIDPRLAFEHCGMFPDPELAYAMSMAYYMANKPAEPVVEEPAADDPGVAAS